jgi:octaprenyl-diphosphate synthase
MPSVQHVEIYPPLPGLLSRVESEIQRVWESERGFLSLSVRKVLSGRGKRLRPAVTLLAAEAAGGAGDRAVTFAAVVEIVHTASLIHDDVVDGALSRRGRRSAKADWGNKVSVLLGDYLIARAFTILSHEDRDRLAPALAEVARRMCDGQIQELRLSGRVISEAQYLDIVRAKTGALFGLCGKAGVVTAGGAPEMAEALQRYGEEFGFAFQIADDILDLVGSNGRSGKPQGRDLAERKTTLPLILAAKRSRELRAQFNALLGAGQITADSARCARELVESTRALEHSWSRVHESLVRARAALEPVPESEAKRALLAMAGDRFPLPVMS